MTQVTEALNRIARQCGVKAPSSWITAARDDHVEIRDDFLRETVDDIADRVDLPSPTGKTQTLTGTGSTNSDGSETFTLNSDFVRMQRDELAFYDPQQDRPVVPVTDSGQWQFLTDVGAAGAIKYYRLQGYDGNYTVDVYNPPGSGDTVTVHYVSNVWLATAGGTEGTTLANDDDVLLLPRRIVEVGTVWRFRERRGLPYDDKYKEYEALLSRLSNDSRGRRKVSFAEPDKDVRWQDLVPNFIPSS